MSRAELLTVDYVNETTFRLSERVAAEACGVTVFPLPPIGVPAPLIRNFPAFYQGAPSAGFAYEDARVKASADFLVDVREEWEYQSFPFFARHCVTVSGMAAHLVK